MATIENLRKGHKLFYQKYFVKNPEVYKKLVNDGQSPKTLVIACSDSRVSPSILLNAKPGDIFSIRNVANLVPPFIGHNSPHAGTSSAIEYAVNILNVQNIIVLGHSHCGGIKTLLNEDQNTHSFIDDWLYIAEKARSLSLSKKLSFEETQSLCEKESIKISIQNLQTFPFVQKKILSKSLKLYGWYFCLEKGSIEEIVSVHTLKKKFLTQ